MFNFLFSSSSFSVGVKGNSTCLISSQTPVLENLETHPEYDVYARKRQDSLSCDFDRIYRNFNHKNGNHLMKINKLIKKEFINNDNSFSKLLSKSEPILLTPHNTLSFSRNKNDMENYGPIGTYDLFTNRERYSISDDNRNILDIIKNKNGRIPIDDFVMTCHRKVQPGKKMMGLFIERITNCENLQDCYQACDYEKTFVCKGFNHHRRYNTNSKCTCELTSTPYSCMDIDEDFSIDSHYDYYEKIENCPSSTWRDSGISHWKDHIKNYKQNDDQNTRFGHESNIHQETYSSINRELANDFSNGPSRSGKQSHYEDGFMSRYRDLNWNRNWKNSPRYSDIINDNTYPSSLINYDKEYSDVRSSVSSRFGEHSPIQEHISIPNEDEQFRGKFYNYGNAFGYNDNYMSSPRESYYEKHENLQMAQKCSIKIVSGSKLSRSILRKTCVAHDLEQCEEFCINETDFSCKSFAYRYNVVTTNPTDNCLLSEHSYQDLNFYTDLEPNRDYDSYGLTSDTRICHIKKSANRYPSEECFSRIRSGFNMPIDITRKSLSVQDFGECQFACTTSQEFVCRSFVFKYTMINQHKVDNHEHLSSNCFLSDWPAEEINPVNMPDMDGAELYERNILSHGCEMYPSPLSIPNTITQYGKKFPPMDQLCYSEYHRPCKLMSHAIVSSLRAVTKSDCLNKCSIMRNSGVIPCMSFNYIITIDNAQNNCFLSDISIRDLRPNLDYIRDNDHMLYTWKEFDPYCSLTAFNMINATPKYEKHGELYPNMFNYPNTEKIVDRERTHRPTFYSPVQWKNKFRDENYEQDYKHKLLFNGNSNPPFQSDNLEHEFNLFYSNQISPFRRYTVNGYPCKNGTICQQNEITGFWSCETENEHGSWDYCCEPNHQCGFSQGYHYPWCHVGSNEDQWRPCSETYYPYYHAMDHSTYRQSIARHWPMIYFHETSQVGS